MPRSFRGLVRADPEEDPPDDLDEWGVAPEDDDEDGPGAPPSLPTAAEEATDPSDALRDIGAPPDDALGQASWARRILMRQAYDLLMSKVPDSTRRKEVRTILRDAARHFTDAARYDYMQQAKRDKEELDRKKRGKAAGKMVPRAPASEGKLIPMPLRSDG